MKTTTKTIVLDNELKLVLVNDPTAPIICIRSFIAIGSIFENQYTGTGISHFVEHLVAGGSTNKKSANEYEKEISLLGGVSNAYTTTDHTSYFINTTTEYIQRAIEIHYEWLFHCQFKENEVIQERNVICREIEKNNADNSNYFHRLCQENTYKTHQAKHPVIGHLSNFLTLTKQDLENFVISHQ